MPWLYRELFQSRFFGRPALLVSQCAHVTRVWMIKRVYSTAIMPGKKAASNQTPLPALLNPAPLPASAGRVATPLPTFLAFTALPGDPEAGSSTS